jgi:hypothetical protein
MCYDAAIHCFPLFIVGDSEPQLLIRLYLCIVAFLPRVLCVTLRISHSQTIIKASAVAWSRNIQVYYHIVT